MKKSRLNLYLNSPVAEALKAYCQKQGYSYGEALEPIIWHYFQSFAPTGAPPQTQSSNHNRTDIDNVTMPIVDRKETIDNISTPIDDRKETIDNVTMPIDEEPMPMPEPDSYRPQSQGERYVTRTLHH